MVTVVGMVAVAVRAVLVVLVSTGVLFRAGTKRTLREEKKKRRRRERAVTWYG